MKTVLTLVLLAAVAGGARAEEALTGPIHDRSRICMMQDTLQPKPGLAHEYQGKTYWLCCQMCVQSFSADPERFAHAKDPVDGATVDKATAPAYAVDGRAFYFRSEDNLRAFSKNPARYLDGPGRGA
jgi:Cu+-exporting ATPase